MIERADACVKGVVGLCGFEIRPRASRSARVLMNQSGRARSSLLVGVPEVHAARKNGPLSSEKRSLWLVEIYIDEDKIIEMERDLDSAMNRVVWQGTLRHGKHDMRAKVHYDVRKETRFRGEIDLETDSEFLVSITHAGRYGIGSMDTDFNPKIQVSNAGKQLPNT